MKSFIFFMAVSLLASFQTQAAPKGIVQGITCSQRYRHSNVVIIDLDLRAMMFIIRTENPTSARPLNARGMIGSVENQDDGSVEYSLYEGPQLVGFIKTAEANELNPNSHFEYKGEVLGDGSFGFECHAQQ